jgi:hypothetical protein
VIETDVFDRQASALLSEPERAALVDYVARVPDCGVPLGAGLRKFRFARPGAGKRGGYRVIHFFQAETGGPVVLLLIFAKNAQANLTSAELEQVKSLARKLKFT